MMVSTKLYTTLEDVAQAIAEYEWQKLGADQLLHVFKYQEGGDINAWQRTATNSTSTIVVSGESLSDVRCMLNLLRLIVDEKTLTCIYLKPQSDFIIEISA